MGETLTEICRKASEAKYDLAKLDTNTKNKILLSCKDALISFTPQIIKANNMDMEIARDHGMSEGLLDRLRLTSERIVQIAEGMAQVAALDDPIGEVLAVKKRPNGLSIGQKRVPMGVIGVIYEARPNVTADVFALCFKTNNVVVLKGGSAALHSNAAIVNVFHDVLEEYSLPKAFVSLIEETDRESTQSFMKMNQYIDVLIPRGGKGLIDTVVQNATIPVIETGTGNCHIYVDDSADLSMACDIVINAKTQRIGVCNAAESLLVHEKVAEEFLPMLKERIAAVHEVEFFGDDAAEAILPGISHATEEDWGREYLDYMMSVKVVSTIDEAISHINKYNTGHSEAIVTENYDHAMQFTDEVDAACVYVNASTRFTDGFEFGFGAEIGISTQKLHARGPMGLLALCSSKYVIFGNGQIRQ